MKNALKIATVARIGIFVHWTFGLLLVGIFAFYLINGTDPAAALLGIGLILAVFACVVLHELGHALTAGRFDVPTRDITLYPIGGVARLQRIPDEPVKEFWIAIAGPAVNLAIALLLIPLVLLTGGSLTPAALVDPTAANFPATLLWLNLVLVGFNLLPAFPMDGGRVLRALLATRLAYARATQIAAGIGQGMAILFGFMGLITLNPILLFIALFVYIGAQQEAQQTLLRGVIEGIPVRQAMMTRFRTLDPDESIQEAIEELLAGAEHDFPVVRDGRVLGVLTRKDMLRTLAGSGRDTRVGDVLPEGCFTIDDGAMLDEALQRMHAESCQSVPVVRNGRLVGLLTLENVGELMMISTALRKTGLDRSTMERLLERE